MIDKLIRIALAAMVIGSLAGTASMAQSPPAEVPGMALIPEGEFWMGRTHMFLFDELNWTLAPRLDDQPAHIVTLDAFHMDQYEVTNKDYAGFVEATGGSKPWHWGGKLLAEKEKLPVYNVSWTDAQAYCQWAGKRLPTEAEWEKAARGGLDRKLYEWGNELPKGGRYGGGEGKNKPRAHFGRPDGPAPVGSYPANGYGLYDMSGNVSEWVGDWYDRYYYVWSPLKNPQGPDTGMYRLARGVAWSYAEDVPKQSVMGAHFRNYTDPSQLSNVLGFRCTKSASEPERAAQQP